MYTYPQNGYKTLFDANPFSLIIFEKDSFNILDANSAASELYGYSHGEFLEMKFCDLFCENIPAGSNPAARFQRKPEVYHLKKNGLKFLVNVKISDISVEDKTAYLLTAFPVELKLSGDNLKVFYSAIVDSTDDAVIGKTLDGKIVSWNRGAERIYGYRAGEVLGKHISIIAPPEKQSEIDDIMEKLRRGEQIRHFETQRMKKDGKIIWVSVTISPVKDASGKIIGASTIDRNI